MDAEDRERLERPVRDALAAGEVNVATTAALRLYGGELYAFMAGVAGEPALADDAYSELCEVVWTRLVDFRWEASLRTWLYGLARRLVVRVRVDGYRRGQRTRPLELAPEIAALAEQLRTRTLEILRTDVKDAFRALRQQLPVDDQELLALRVDRAMSWRDIARILESERPERVDQQAALLRKRFERVRARLRELALARGLLPEQA